MAEFSFPSLLDLDVPPLVDEWTRTQIRLYREQCKEWERWQKYDAEQQDEDWPAELGYTI